MRVVAVLKILFVGRDGQIWDLKRISEGGMDVDV
jgi:hypothetical protein